MFDELKLNIQSFVTSFIEGDKDGLIHLVPKWTPKAFTDNDVEYWFSRFPSSVCGEKDDVKYIRYETTGAYRGVFKITYLEQSRTFNVTDEKGFSKIMEGDELIILLIQHLVPLDPLRTK